MKTLRAYKDKMIINGHELEVLINIQYDHDNSNYVYEYEHASEQQKKLMDSSELFLAYIQVSVLAEGFEGQDSLSTIFVLRDKIFDNIMEIVEIYKLIENAKYDVTNQILEAAKTLPRYLAYRV